MPETETTATSTRRFVKLSLRLAMLLIALVALWLAWLTNRARRQEEVVRELREKGAVIAFDYEYPPGVDILRGRKNLKAQPAAPAWLRRAVGEDYFRKLVRVDCASPGPPRLFGQGDAPSDTRENDAFLRRLVARGGLRSLGLHGLNVSGRALADCAPKLGDLESLVISRCPSLDDNVFSLVARLPKLQELTINVSKLTARSLEAVGSRPYLRTLALQSETVDGEGLKHLRTLRNLEALSLLSPLIDDDAIASFDFPKLTLLSLNSPRIAGAGVKPIGRLTSLTDLRLYCGASDEGMEALRPLKNLISLHVCPTSGALSDRALEALHDMPKLRSLTIGHSIRPATQFSDTALVDLVRALPGLRTLSIESHYFGRQAINNLVRQRPGLRIRSAP